MTMAAYYAVQLAVALRHATNFAPFRIPLMFVSGDRTLLTAAQVEQLPTDNPFDHVVSTDTPRAKLR